MKIAFRNFLTTLKRYKTASVLNIAGLTLAFMALYILISQVMYDVRYNRSIDDYARVYMACTYNSEDAYSYNQVPRLPLEQRIEACPRSRLEVSSTSSLYRMVRYGYDGTIIV